jgi:hypothetical protein
MGRQQTVDGRAKILEVASFIGFSTGSGRGPIVLTNAGNTDSLVDRIILRRINFSFARRASAAGLDAVAVVGRVLDRQEVTQLVGIGP